MYRSVLFLISLLFGLAVAPPPSSTKQYRPDYVYNKRTDAFYKLHIDTARYQNAKTFCEVEGATLMIPTTKEDVVQVHALLKRFPDIGDMVWVGDDGQAHESAEETPIIDLSAESNEDASLSNSVCDVVTRRGEIETARCFGSLLPYVCKVEANKAPYNEQCDVYAPYEYKASVRSCYRVPPVAYTWDQAFATCRDEGAHLAIVNSVAERDVIKQILNAAPKIPNAYTSYFFHAGFRANRPTDGSARVFRTIFNETLTEAGYEEWSGGEPNNHLDTEYCGSIFSNNGKYNDVNCDHTYGFLCEKEVR